MKYIFIIFYSSFAFSAPKSFGEAKTILNNSIYLHKGRTFYCNCQYQKKSIKTKSCKLNVKKYKKRQKRLEWEHIVPVAAYGHSFKEYRNAKTLCKRIGKRALSSRKCASKLNPLFKQMEGDVHNLVPAIGAINALRSNYSFSDLKTQGKQLCDNGFWIKGRKVEPPQNRKGDIARIYFYMDKKYPNRGIISKKNRKLFNSWSTLDPVSAEECELSAKKALVQQEVNIFVHEKCPKKTTK